MLIKIFYILIFFVPFWPLLWENNVEATKKYITSYDNINYLISIPPPKGPITKKKGTIKNS